MINYTAQKPTGTVGKRNGNFKRIAARVANLRVGGPGFLIPKDRNARQYVFIAAQKHGFQVKTKSKEKSILVNRIAVVD